MTSVSPRPGRACALVALGFAALLGGCASTPECSPPVGSRTLTPAQVAATGGHSGELQRWGGVLASARNLPETTELEVIGYPLDSCGEPRTGADPIGRFLVVKDGYLETADYPPGTRVAATGILLGVREGKVGAASYRFPLLKGNDIRWWRVDTVDRYDGYRRPWFSIGVGGGSGSVGGGIGVLF